VEGGTPARAATSSLVIPFLETGFEVHCCLAAKGSIFRFATPGEYREQSWIVKAEMGSCSSLEHCLALKSLKNFGNEKGHSLTWIAAERHLRVGRPFKAGTWVTQKGIRAASAALESRTSHFVRRDQTAFL